MRAHSLIATGLGIGLMAASLGAVATPAQHSFDYSSIYYNATASGVTFEVFVPTRDRASAGVKGANGVLMLELYQPGSGTASTWAYAVGDLVTAVGAIGGASDTVGFSSSYSAFYTGAAGSDIASQSMQVYPGVDGSAVTLSFSQPVTVSSAACQVSFSAEMDANDVLRFKSVAVAPAGWATATGTVFVVTGTASTASSNFQSFATSKWNAVTGSAANPLATFTAVGTKLYADTGGTGATTALTGGSAAVADFNKCVAAWTSRNGGTAVSPVFGGGATATTFNRLW